MENLLENYVGKFTTTIYFTTKVLGQTSDTLSKFIYQFLFLFSFITECYVTGFEKKRLKLRADAVGG